MKIKVIYRKDQANNNGACPLVLRLTHDRKVKFLALGVSVNPEQWNDAEQQVAGDDAVNLLISSKLSDLRKRIAKLEALDMEVNLDNLLGAKSKRINCTISDFFNQQIERMQSIGKIGTAGKYRYCLRLLSQCNPVNIRFEQVDMAYLRDFETFLLSKANASNSVATKFSVLKAVYNDSLPAIPDLSLVGDAAGSMFSIFTPDAGGQTDNRYVRRIKPPKKKRGLSV